MRGPARALLVPRPFHTRREPLPFILLPHNPRIPRHPPRSESRRGPSSPPTTAPRSSKDMVLRALTLHPTTPSSGLFGDPSSRSARPFTSEGCGGVSGPSSSIAAVVIGSSYLNEQNQTWRGIRPGKRGSGSRARARSGGTAAESHPRAELPSRVCSGAGVS